MPTYEYACSSCGRRFEVVQKFSDAPLETCDVCGGKIKRVFHPVGIVLKGSGFYSTDNRSGKSLAAGTKESDKSAPAEKAPAADTKTSTDTGSSTKGGGSDKAAS